MKIASILPAPFLLSLLSGLLFVLIFAFFSDQKPWVSDDGVITMSHGRNLVDYGFIGINPSGGRVEGYSAPVQFFLYTAAYAMTGVGYAAYSEAQTYIATFLLGALLVLFFFSAKNPCHRRGRSGRGVTHIPTALSGVALFRDG